MTRYRIELMHKIDVLFHFATNPDKDTISALSETQAREIIYKLNEVWKIIDRRKSK